MARSASDASLVNPPYGCCEALLEEDDSDRSRVQCVPKYFVPLRPKIKPMDHWDLLVAYDAAKHRSETEAFVFGGNPVKHKARALLDSQMLEIKAIKEQEAADKRKEAEDMLKQVEENKRLDALEASVHQAKMDKLKENNAAILGAMGKNKQREKERARREEEMMTTWLDNEAKRREEEHRVKSELHAAKCKSAREEMIAAIEEKKRQKAAKQAEDRKVVAEQVRRADDAVAKNKAAVKQRMDQIDKNCKTLGAQIAKRDADNEHFMAERLRKALEEGDRNAREDEQRRKSLHQQRTRAMIAGLDEQMRVRAENNKDDKEEAIKLQALWVQQCEEDRQKERDKMEKARRARDEMDKNLIGQIRETAGVHPRTRVLTADEEAQDLAQNRALYEKIASEGFQEDLTGSFLSKATYRGKLTPFPSVGPHEGEPLHPTEKQVPPIS